MNKPIRKEKIKEKIFTLLFNLYQSHDCRKDTACKFEDRLGKVNNKIYKLVEKL
jgi:hypothetical protein